MVEQATVSNMGLNDDARTFVFTIDVPEPQEDQVLNLMLRAPFPFEIVQVDHQIIAGILDAEILNAGVTVDLSDANTAGFIPADVTPSEHVPVATSAFNYTVAGEAALNVILHNVETGAAGYTIQITCRRTQVNA